MSESSATITVSDGLIFLASEASTMPSVLPRPAAPMTSPMRRVVRSSQPGMGSALSRNTTYIVRKPDSHRGPQLTRSAKATFGGIPVYRRPAPPPTSSSTDRSPSVESTFAGSRIARTVPSTNTRNA